MTVDNRQSTKYESLKPHSRIWITHGIQADYVYRKVYMMTYPVNSSLAIKRHPGIALQQYLWSASEVIILWRERNAYAADATIANITTTATRPTTTTTTITTTIITTTTTTAATTVLLILVVPHYRQSMFTWRCHGSVTGENSMRARGVTTRTI